LKIDQKNLYAYHLNKEKSMLLIDPEGKEITVLMPSTKKKKKKKISGTTSVVYPRVQPGIEGSGKAHKGINSSE
jgi:hypothetical protein